jgi:hypothetical protein
MKICWNTHYKHNVLHKFTCGANETPHRHPFPAPKLTYAAECRATQLLTGAADSGCLCTAAANSARLSNAEGTVQPATHTKAVTALQTKHVTNMLVWSRSKHCKLAACLLQPDKPQPDKP